MRKELTYAILLIIASVFFLMLRVPLEVSLNEWYDNPILSKSLSGIGIRLILIISLLYFMYKKGFLPFNGLSPSFTVSNLFLFYISVVIILVLAYSSYEVYFASTPGKLILFGISNLLVGVFEELLFRGLVFPLLILHYAGKNRPILKAAFLSSLFFGLIHLVGLIRHPENIFNVSNVVIYAVGIGFLFACLLLRTRNILIPALVHFLVDFTNGANDLNEEVIAQTAPTQSTIIVTLIAVSVLSLIFIGAGMILFKRVDQEEWLQKASLIRL